MTDNQMILDALSRIEEKADRAATLGATIVERVSNLNDKVEAHLTKDDTIHEGLREDITELQRFNTSLKARIGIYTAIAGAIFTGAIEVLKGVWDGSHHLPPPHG